MTTPDAPGRYRCADCQRPGHPVKNPFGPWRCICGGRIYDSDPGPSRLEIIRKQTRDHEPPGERPEDLTWTDVLNAFRLLGQVGWKSYINDDGALLFRSLHGKNYRSAIQSLALMSHRQPSDMPLSPAVRMTLMFVSGPHMAKNVREKRREIAAVFPHSPYRVKGEPRVRQA